MTNTLPPAVRILAADYDRLVAVAEGVNATSDAARFLRQELGRAQLISNPAIAAAQMGSRVRYRDHDSERVHEVRLVYPTEADIARGRVSVLTPVGAALIGLEEGASMSWRDRAGAEKTLTVLEVE